MCYIIHSKSLSWAILLGLGKQIHLISSLLLCLNFTFLTNQPTHYLAKILLISSQYVRNLGSVNL